ncbi:hypothetical protein FIBSPDRAFT_1053009 [Athelia psychrophila]|uniref:Uncharacterized protein n=1 Tax=Athelia psychrophila TaxID=1759441 RepID=A0A167XMR0_9AGAM|nr:hypothetical protein FIBSPDRAFT_1053009 [Fibularhizoctonia sp. CBS 109695]
MGAEDHDEGTRLYAPSLPDDSNSVVDSKPSWYANGHADLDTNKHHADSGMHLTRIEAVVGRSDRTFGIGSCHQLPSTWPRFSSTSSAYETQGHRLEAQQQTHRHDSLIIVEALGDKSRANIATRYATSKLLEVFCIRALTELHPADKYPATVNRVSWALPRCAYAKGWMAVVHHDALGSRGLLYAAQYGPERHRKWIYDKTIPAPGKFITTPQGQNVEKRPWNELVERLEKISPGVTQNWEQP